MSRIYRKANGDQIIIGASKAASRSRAASTPPPAATDFEFGDLTTAGNAPVDIGAAGITITGGDTSGHFQTADSGGRTLLSVSSVGATAELSGSPYSLTLSNGSTITVSGIADAVTVDSLAELQTIIRSSSTPYGRKIYLREGGDYETAPPLDSGRLRPASFTGTWTAPSNYAAYHQGVDLDTGNYVRVMAHTGETPTITTVLTVEAFSTGSARVRFTGITFNKTDAGQSSAIATGMLNILGSSDLAIDGCTFQALNSTDYGVFERRPGISTGSSGGAGGSTCSRIVIQNNTINDCYDGIRWGVGGTDACMVGNTIRRTPNDGVKIGHSDRVRYCWNFVIDKLGGASGSHGDFFQMASTGSKDPEDVWVVGNVHARGAGTPGSSDGQGIFIDDLGASYTYQRYVIVGNRCVVRFINNIALTAADRASPDVSNSAFIRNNTCLMEPGNNFNALINIEGPTTGLDRNYNLVSNNNTASGTDIFLTRYAGVDAAIVGGQAGITDSAIGSTLAEVVANTNIIAASSPDTASPKVGAHQDYINYTTRTLSLPYSLPAAP